MTQVELIQPDVIIRTEMNPPITVFDSAPVRRRLMRLCVTHGRGAKLVRNANFYRVPGCTHPHEGHKKNPAGTHWRHLWADVFI